MLTASDVAKLKSLVPRPLTPTEQAQLDAEIAASARPVPSWYLADDEEDDEDDD